MARPPSNPIKKVRKNLSSSVFGRIDLDDLSKTKIPKAKEGVRALKHFRGKMPIEHDLVPEVDSALDSACARLGFPREMVHGFIENCGEMNATCWGSSLTEGHAVVSITSAAVERLSYDELVYVFGHELGHFFFPHSYLRDASSHVASFEDAATARRMEIFMDRIGLIACRNVSFAASAAMKIASGLGSAHLRANVAAYGKEAIKGFSVAPDAQDFISSHPPLFLRIRALMLFAESDAYLSLIESEGGRPVAEVNQEIEKDLVSTVDAVAEKHMHKLVSDIPNFLVAFAKTKGDSIPAADFEVGDFKVDPEEVKEWMGVMAKIPKEKFDDAIQGKIRDLSIRAAINWPRFVLGYMDQLHAKLDGKAVQKVVGYFKSEIEQALKHHIEEKSYRFR